MRSLWLMVECEGGIKGAIIKERIVQFYSRTDGLASIIWDGIGGNRCVFDTVEKVEDLVARFDGKENV